MTVAIENTVYELNLTSPSNYTIETGRLISVNTTYEAGAVETVNNVSPVDGNISLTQDDIPDGTTNKVFTTTEKTKLSGIETGAEVNNISDINATDLTDGGETTLHTHNLDHITDGTTYKLVTPAEKSTWNGKQDALGFTAENVANKENVTIDTSTTKYPTINLLKTARDSRKYWHGIEAAGALSFDDTSHILTIASGTNTYWYKGTKYTTSSAITCDLDSYITLANNKLYYVFFEDATGTLKASEDFWDLKEKVPVATVIWNGSTGAVQNELHGYMRDLDWHINAHLTIGARYYSGLSQTLPSTAVDNQIQIEAGVIYDEDIRINIVQQTDARHFYQASSGVYTFVNSNLPYINNAGTVQYLRTSDYSLQAVGASNFVNMWVYASDDIDRNIYIIPTQATSAFNTLNLARAETPPNLNGLNITPELKLIYRWTYKGDGEYQEAVDYRQSSSLPAGGSASTTASTVTFTPTGNISSTNVQSAIAELDTEKQANLTFGIANTNSVVIDSADVTSGEIARFTASGLESRTNAEMKTQLAYLTDLVDDQTPQLYTDLDCNEKDLDNVKNIIHDQATASDFVIQNIDQDKDIKFSCNDGGSQTDIMILDGSEGQLSGILKATNGVVSAVASFTRTYYEVKTWTVQGEIKVPSSGSDVLPPFEVNLISGQTAKIVKWSGAIESGTSATFKLQQSDGAAGAFADISGFTAFEISGGYTNPSSSNPSDYTLADGQVIQPVCTAVSGTPKNLMLNVVIEYTLTIS